MRLEGETGNSEDRLYGHDCLPLLQPNLTIAAVVAVDRDKKSRRVRQIIDTKYDATKGTLWTTFTNAQKSAKLVSKPAPNAEHGNDDDDDDLETVVSVGGTARKKAKSYTVNGLKRWSRKQTEKALKGGGLIKGVITHSKDPYIMALEAENEAMADNGGSTGSGNGTKKGGTNQPFVINVTANSKRASKWGGGGSGASDTGDNGGGVESFESIDQRALLLQESKNGGWRQKLRAEQEEREKEIEKRRREANARFYVSKGMTEEEMKEEQRRIAQQESTEEMTMSIEAKRLANKNAARSSRKSRKSNKKRKQDPNAPKEGDFVGEGVGVGGIGDVNSEFGSETGGDNEDTLAKAHLTADRQSSNIAALLAQAGVQEAQWGNLFGDNGNIGGGILHDEENESSLIAMTEEEELQLAYEQRIKAEHEEARRKRQERREQILKKNSLAFLDGGEDNEGSDK